MKCRILKEYSNLREILTDKGLAKLGDSVTNMIYSVAKSCVLSEPEGGKVPDKVLARAFRDTQMRRCLPRRASVDGMGDAVEALIAYTWLRERFTIESLVSVLSKEMHIQGFQSRRTEWDMAVKAFAALLERIEPWLMSL